MASTPLQLHCWFAGQDVKRAEQKLREKDEEEAKAATAAAEAEAVQKAESEKSIDGGEAPKKKGWLW
jgi:hypothetical protein